MAIKNTNISPLLKEGSNITLTQDGQVITIAATGTTGTPGGSNTQVQFNDSGSFGGDAGLTYNKTTDTLTAGSLSLTTILNATTDTDKFLVSDGGVIKYRTGAELLSDIGGGGISGSGSSGQIAYWTGASAISGESNLFWDATNDRLGIGTNSPQYKLHILFNDNNSEATTLIENPNTGTSAISASYFKVNGVNIGQLAGVPSNFSNTALRSTFLFGSLGANKVAVVANANVSGSAQDIYLSTIGNNSTYQLQIKGSTGNVQINTNTDSGYRLDVYGTTRVYNNDNNYNSSLVIENPSSGTAALSSIFFTLNTVNIGQVLAVPSNSILTALQSTFIFGSLGANKVGIIANSNSNGSAQDIYLSTIGNNSTYQLQIKGSTGNVQINTNTDAGYKLDINGTTRTQGDFTISDTKNIILGTSTGTKIGTATSQKIGFFNATPVVQPTSVNTTQGLADTLTTLGLLQSSSISTVQDVGGKLYLFNSY